MGGVSGKRRLVEQGDAVVSSDEESEDVILERLWKQNSNRPQRDFFPQTDCNRPSVFKPTRRSHVMFPHRDRTLKWDDYGEPIEHDMFLDPHLVAKGSMELKKQAPLQDNSIELVDLTTGAAEERPTKCVSEKRSLKIKCKLAFIDYEGRSDGDSVKKIIAHCKPKQLILVRSSEASATAVVDYCLNDAKVELSALVPKYGETVDATLESFIHQVKLTDSLMAGLEWSRVRGIELTWVDGAISAQSEKEFLENNDGHNQIEQLNITGSGSKVPLLQKLPRANESNHDSTQGNTHDTVFVNEIRLNEFKMVLTKNGLPAEFIMGVLVVNGRVAVKRLKTGHISVEGCLCEDYYKVRELLYQQFAVL